MHQYAVNFQSYRGRDICLEPSAVIASPLFTRVYPITYVLVDFSKKTCPTFSSLRRISLSFSSRNNYNALLHAKNETNLQIFRFHTNLPLHLLPPSQSIIPNLFYKTFLNKSPKIPAKR